MKKSSLIDRNGKIDDEWLLTPKDRAEKHKFCHHVPRLAWEADNRPSDRPVIERLPSGLEVLDKNGGGLGLGTVTVIASNISTGAPALMNHIVHHNAFVEQLPTAYFVFDLEFADIQRKLVALESDINYSDLLEGKMTADQWDRVNHVARRATQLPFYFYELRDPEPEQILRYIQDHQDREPLKLIAIRESDILFRLWHEQYGNEAYSVIASMCRTIAEQFNAAVLIEWGVNEVMQRSPWPGFELVCLQGIRHLNPLVETVWGVWDNFNSHCYENMNKMEQFELSVLKQPGMARRLIGFERTEDSWRIGNCRLLSG